MHILEVLKNRNKLVNKLSMLAIFFSFFVVIPAWGDTIHKVPGTLDDCKIITPWSPWSDYIAVQNGSTVWVGTEDEYMHADTPSQIFTMA
jgi:hypothetical protein